MHEGLWLCGKKIVPAVNIYVYVYIYIIVRVYTLYRYYYNTRKYYPHIYIYNIKILYYRVAENEENKM